MPNEVWTFKLNSGEEVIGRVDTVPTTGLIGTITIKHPMSVAPSQNGLGLIPSMFTMDEDATCTLNLSSVALCAPTADAIRNKYIESTSKLVVPSKKIIMG